MPRQDNLRINLPAAIDAGDQILARAFDVWVYVNAQHAYRRLEIGPIRYFPGHVPTYITVTAAGRDVAQIAGIDGTIDVRMMIDESEPTRFTMYNLSDTSSVSYTVMMRGWLANELPRP